MPSNIFRSALRALFLLSFLYPGNTRGIDIDISDERMSAHANLMSTVLSVC